MACVKKEPGPSNTNAADEPSQGAARPSAGERPPQVVNGQTKPRSSRKDGRLR